MTDGKLNRSIVNSITPMDMVAGSIAKPIIERAVSPVLGNGNFLSGATKLLGAGMAATYAGNGMIGKAIAIGAGMDGAEDIIIAIGNKAGLGTTESTEAGVF